MQAELTVLEPGVAIDDVLAVLATDGGVIVRNLLASDLLERFRNDIESVASEHAPGATTGSKQAVDFWGQETKRFTRLGWRSPAFEEILLAPTLSDVADHLLLPSCDDYWLNTGQVMIIGPGETEQPWHRDSDNWPMLCSPGAPEATVSCMYAIGEFSAANGATRVVPGSHLWEDFGRAPRSEEVAVAEMQSGDGMIYTGQVIHHGGSNVTADQWRLGLHVSFVLGWLTPEEALPISTPWEAAEHMSERARRLLGWNSYGENVRLWTVDYEQISIALGHSS